MICQLGRYKIFSTFFIRKGGFLVLILTLTVLQKNAASQSSRDLVRKFMTNPNNRLAGFTSIKNDHIKFSQWSLAFQIY